MSFDDIKTKASNSFQLHSNNCNLWIYWQHKKDVPRFPPKIDSQSITPPGAQTSNIIHQAFQLWASLSNCPQLYPISLTSASRSQHQEFSGSPLSPAGSILGLSCNTVITWLAECVIKRSAASVRFLTPLQQLFDSIIYPHMRFAVFNWHSGTSSAV